MGRFEILSTHNHLCRKLATVDLSEFCLKFAASVGKLKLSVFPTFFQSNVENTSYSSKASCTGYIVTE